MAHNCNISNKSLTGVFAILQPFFESKLWVSDSGVGDRAQCSTDWGLPGDGEIDRHMDRQRHIHINKET